MPVSTRPRGRALRHAGRAAALTALSLGVLAACGPSHPLSIFTDFTEFNREIGFLFKILIILGTIVFVFVEALLIWAIVKYRRREGQKAPEHVHGNTTLEIIWTAIPALILVIIAVPTVRTIFKTQAKVKPGALEVQVIGHQWWWEFRYPEYGITTANELYLPLGRTVNFKLETQDVIHSFWIPQLGGKRDLIANHTNYLWYTPDSAGVNAWVGHCVEYCGASHANMRFRAFTVSPQEFEGWVAHMRTGAANPLQPAAPAVPAAPAATTPVQTASIVPAPAPPAAAPAAPAYAGFPRERLGRHLVPSTPVPAGIQFNAALQGDVARGGMAFATGRGGCIGCHAIKGVPTAVGIVGPNLSHYGSRTTLAASFYPNDARHLALWIKNARKMKPGVIMPTLGKGEIDPQTKQPVPDVMALDDQTIADMVAYLLSLK
ncbi:MAG TPA: cytochrome c oxidase subunit II [Gemmatimonadaceae bacterium]|nr:cytochrome c oxidase subunit II [Gemmatimonadaceae bacterium]